MPYELEDCIFLLREILQSHLLYRTIFYLLCRELRTALKERESTMRLF